MSFRALGEIVVGLCNSVFGDDVSYTPNGGSASSIKGVFNNAWVDIEGVVSLKPTLRIKLADLDDSPGKGDEVEIDEVEYRVMESREDGHGGTTLILQKV